MTANTQIGVIERKLFYHTNNHKVWTYNSENIALPRDGGYTPVIKAELRGPGGPECNFHASVKIIGYRKSSATEWSGIVLIETSSGLYGFVNLR